MKTKETHNCEPNAWFTILYKSVNVNFPTTDSPGKTCVISHNAFHTVIALISLLQIILETFKILGLKKV